MSKCIRDHNFNEIRTGAFKSGESRGKYRNMSRNEFSNLLKSYQGDNFADFVDHVEASYNDDLYDDYEDDEFDFINVRTDSKRKRPKHTKGLNKRSSGGSGYLSELLDIFLDMSSKEKFAVISRVLVFFMVLGLLTHFSIWPWWGRLLNALTVAIMIPGDWLNKIFK